MFRSLFVATAAAASVLLIVLTGPYAHASRADARDTHTVVVTEGLAYPPSDGCGAVSVFDDRDDGSRAFRGPNLPSVGWLTADWMDGLFMAGPGSGSERVYRLQRVGDGTEWRAERLEASVYDAPAIVRAYGGVTLVDDGAAMVAAVYRGPTRPYGVARLPDPATVVTGFLRAANVAPTGPSFAPVVLASPEGAEVVALTRNGELYTFRVEDLSYSAPTIALPQVVLDTIYYASFFHAALSPGGRYFITGRADLPEFTVVDRQTMAVTTVDASRWITMTGDFAFSAGWHNDGLLAVHGGTRIGVFRFDPEGAFEPLAMATVDAPRWSRDARRVVGGPIAWSGDGSKIIAGISSGVNEFGVYHVRDCGRRLEIDREWAACPHPSNSPRDILTANGLLPTPAGHTPSCPTPAWNDDYTPGPHTTSTITPTPWEEGVPWVHLPAVLRMR